MKTFDFPLQFFFKIWTFSNDFTATDANGKTIAYVRQKIFKFKEEINIYADESRTKINYRINADRWLDFSAAYSFTDKENCEFGKIVRKGWASIWKADYELIDQHERLQYHIREENAWAKVFDTFLGEIPILNFFTGYIFNPSYKVMDLNGRTIIRLHKEPSFWGRKFHITQLEEIDRDDQERILLGLMMMILLERRRG